MGARLAGCALALGLLVGVTPAAAKCELQKYVELPVTIQNGGAVVDAKINGADAKLTVDTGAFFSVLYPSTITKFGLNTEPLPSYLRVMRAATGDADFKLTTVKQLTVLGVALNKVQFLVSEHGLFETDGLLGQNLLSLMDTEFDLSDGAIRLLKPVGCGDAALAYWDTGATDSRTYGMMSIDPIAPPDQAIIGTVTINGVKVRAIFDTGATRSMLTLAAAQRADVRTTDPGVVAGGSVGAFGRGQVETWIAPFSLVDFGGEQIKNTRLRIAELHLPYDADMVIGADFFLSHRVYVAKSQNKLYFTYNGGPVFNLDLQSPAGPAAPAPTTTAAAVAAQSPEPTDAAGFSHRGAAFVARGEYALAIADFGRAATLEPNAGRFYDLGMAQWRSHAPTLALSSFDQALKLKPDYAQALLVRGELRMSLKNYDGGKADFVAALALDPSLRLKAADSYSMAGRLEDALADYDLWIAAHPRNEDLARPLNGRCWARAMLDRDLDKALADCNEALQLWPGGSTILDSRGMVFLRLKQPDKAIADYNVALKQAPRQAWSLYGRGLAKQLKGLTGEGAADIAAAIAIDPQIVEEAKPYGISG
jgi:tetratricopeptide (TPR) repeat protein/predicted aspartyl protease